MKKSILLIAAIAITITSCSQKLCKDLCCSSKGTTNTEATDTTSLACKLSTDAQIKRSEELRATIFKKYEKLIEYPDAVELVYADSKEYTPMLVEFITTERACCPFFTFNLKFLPNTDKVSLTIGGSPKIKKVIKAIMN